jgi:hypothetical protein
VPLTKGEAVAAGLLPRDASQAHFRVVRDGSRFDLEVSPGGALPVRGRPRNDRAREVVARLLPLRPVLRELNAGEKSENHARIAEILDQLERVAPTLRGLVEQAIVMVRIGPAEELGRPTALFAWIVRTAAMAEGVKAPAESTVQKLICELTE